MSAPITCRNPMTREIRETIIKALDLAYREAGLIPFNGDGYGVATMRQERMHIAIAREWLECENARKI